MSIRRKRTGHVPGRACPRLVPIRFARPVPGAISRLCCARGERSTVETISRGCCQIEKNGRRRAFNRLSGRRPSARRESSRAPYRRGTFRRRIRSPRPSARRPPPSSPIPTPTRSSQSRRDSEGRGPGGDRFSEFLQVFSEGHSGGGEAPTGIDITS